MPDHVALHEYSGVHTSYYKRNGWNVGDPFDWFSAGKSHTGHVSQVKSDSVVVTFSDRKWPVEFKIIGPKLSLGV